MTPLIRKTFVNHLTVQVWGSQRTRREWHEGPLERQARTGQIRYPGLVSRYCGGDRRHEDFSFRNYFEAPE